MERERERENESIKTEKLHLYADLMKIKEVIFCLGFFPFFFFQLQLNQNQKQDVF